MVSRKRKTLGRILTVALVAVTLTGCFGSTNATARLKTWNREIENRWAGEAMYILLRIPYTGVYGLVGLTDLLILNSIEFWGGSHPVTPVDPARMEALKELDARRHGGGN